MPSYPDEFVPLRTREPQATQPEQPAPGVLETLAAAGRDANWVYRGARYLANRADVSYDPTHNSLDAIKGTKYESDPGRFAYSRNATETEAIMREWDQDEDSRSVLARAGAGGAVAAFVMGNLDPTIALPVFKVFSGVAAGASVARLAADTALSGALGAAIGESVMYATTPDYTVGDAALNVGTATVLSGILGAGAGALMTRAERQGLAAKLHQDRIDMGADITPSAQAGGAAPTDTRAVELVKTPIDKALASVRAVLPESIRSAVPETDLFARFSPTRRVLNSPFMTGRRSLVDLAETPYLFEGNDLGVAVTSGPALDRSAKLAIRQARAGLSDMLESTFTRYRGMPQDASGIQRAVQRIGSGINDLRGQTGGKLTSSQFKDAIDEALRSGDTHAIPEVTEAAQWIRREVIDPWKDRAIAAGMLPEGVEPETAASYMTRNWNKQKLTAQRPEAVRRITDWYESEQTRKRAVQEKLTGLARQLDEAEAKIANLEAEGKAGAQEHLDQIARVDTLRTQVETELKGFKGNSANEALSAIKTRDATPQDPSKPRRIAADKAVSKAMRKIVNSDRTRPRQELEARANETIDRILGNPDGRLAYDDASPSPGFIPAGDQGRGPLASRDFMIPDEMIRDFLETDIEQTLHRFLGTMVPDVLLTERFGDVDMTEAFRKLRDEHTALSMAAKTEKQRATLKKQYDATVADLAAIRDRVRGAYGNTTDPRMRFWGRMAANAGRYNQLTDMGGVVLSSVPDMAGPIFQYGFTKSLKYQSAPLFRLLGSKDMQALSKVSRAELKAMGIGIETVLQARGAAIADVFDMYQPVSKWERGLEKLSNGYFIANGLSPWTDAMQRIAGTVSMDQMSKAVEAAAAGKATKKQLRKLAESGIDSTMAGRIWKELSAEGGSNVVDDVRISNTGAWADKGARDAFEGAVSRDVDMMVISPGQEKSLWPSRNPVVALLLQYKTFVMASTERIFFRGMQARDAQVLQGLVAAIGLGMIGEYAYSAASGRELPKTFGDWVKAGTSRSGVLGWLEEANAIPSKWTGGTTDMYRLIGATNPGSRYQSREGGGVLLGPTWNKLEGLIKAGGTAVNPNIDWGPADTKRVRRLIAGQNLFYIRRALDALGEE